MRHSLVEPGDRGRLVANAQVDAVLGAAEVESDGARLIALSSFERLGLAMDVRVREAVLAAMRRLGAAPVAFARDQRALEQRLANLLQAPAAVLAPSVEPALHWLARRAPGLRVDRRCPWGMSLAGAEPYFDPEEILAPSAPAATRWVLAAGLYASEGDLGALPRTLECARRVGAGLAVLDPLGLGVLGTSGAGAAEQLGLAGQDLVLISGLSSLGGEGWVVAGGSALMDDLRPWVSAPQVPAVAAIDQALRLAAQEPRRRARLFDLTQELLTGLRALRFDTGPCVTPWIPVAMGEESACLQWLDALRGAGIFCHALLRGAQSRLLLSPPATLGERQVATVLDTFARLARRLGRPVLSLGLRAEPCFVSRPGLHALSAPASPTWLQPYVAPSAQPAIAPSTSRAARLQNLIETLTWRAVSQKSARLKPLLALEKVLLRASRRRPR